jgi:toxin ParE1/3/4
VTAVTWRAAALADVARIVRHVAEENPMAARRLAQELVVAGDSLAVFPFRGRRGRRPGTRELVVVRPYILIYEVTPDGSGVEILLVRHAAQEA